MKLRTLYDCRNHWQWLWITGSSEKQSYEPSTNWLSYCACCQHAKICADCPLVGYAWPKACLSSDSFYVCLSPDSFYKRWFNARTKKTRIKYAYKMVQACNRAIEDILCKPYTKEITK